MSPIRLTIPGMLLLAAASPVFLNGAQPTAAAARGRVVEVASPVGRGGSFRIRVEGERVFLSASNADLRVVLRALARASGTSLKLDPRLDEKVNLHLAGVSLGEALTALAKSCALVFEQQGDAYRLTSALVTAQVEEAAPEDVDGAGRTKVEATGRQRMERAWRRHRVLRNGRRDPRLLASRRGKAIVLSHAIVDPVALAAGEELDIPDDLKAPADTEHYIVQFDHRVSARERLQLQQEGIQVSHYVPYSAFAVKVTPGQLERLRNMEGVRAVVPYHPYFKLSREILEYLLGGQDAVALNRVKRGYFRVMLFAEPGAPDGLHQAGFRATEVGAVDSRIIMRVQCSPDRVAELAAVESVGWIEPEIPCRALNDLAVGRVRAGVLRLPDLDLRGDGVIVNVTDTGVDFGHPAFAWDPSQPTSTGVNTRIVYYGVRTNTPTSDGLPGDSDGHGSHVAGTILGNGALSETVFKAPGSGEAPYPADAFAGIAPNALLVMLEDFNSYSPSQQVETAYAHGARISNNSWGNSQYEYSTLSAEFDALVRDADPATPGNQAYIMFFAAGNDGAGNRDGTGGQAGTVGSPGNAKNVITVGALEQPRRADNLADAFEETDSDWELAWFSSRGPVTPTDERVKPDIVAPGSYVLSVQSHDTRPDDLRDEPLPQRDYRYGNVDSGTNYAFFSGTSMATPVAAGAGALIYQYLTNHLGKPPSPALMKAALVAGARMVNSLLYRFPVQGAEPDIVHQGWGLVDVARSIRGPGARSSDEVVYLDQDDISPVGTGESFTYQYTIGPGEGGLRVVLAWSDPPGSPGNGRQLVNDIDLRVLAPGGGGYIGNFFRQDGVHSQKMDDPDLLYGDDRNNVEIVTIPDASPGTYTIEVSGWEVSQGVQDFALVIMKGIGLEGRAVGSQPSVALDTNGWPVVAYSGTDESGYTQVFVQRWTGPFGDIPDIGSWKALEGRWELVAASAQGSGISWTLESSEHPSVAVSGEKIFVAWQEMARDTGAVDHIFLRMFDGSQWVELGDSAHGNGLSGNDAYPATGAVVRVAGDGNPVVAWLQGTASGWTIYLAKWDGAAWTELGGSLSAGVPGAVMPVEPPVMAIDGAGNPVLAWVEVSGVTVVRVRRWTGSSWQDLGDHGYSPGVRSPSLAVGGGGQIYLAWAQYPFGGNPLMQVFLERYSGGGWSAVGGSTTYPGVSAATNAAMQPAVVAVAAASTSAVAVAWCCETNDAVLVRKWDGSSWQGLADSDVLPGVAPVGGVSAGIAAEMGAAGLPVVAFGNIPVQTNLEQVLLYAFVGDSEPPVFAGLGSASGGTNGNVVLEWDPGSDCSTTIYYHVFMSTQWWVCGSSVTCSPAEVFTNQIAVLTNVTQYEVTGLTPNRAYCFGVRASDTNGLMDGNTVTKSAGPITGTGDNDGDCLDNARELAAGTEPCLADTDGDGMWDGWEWSFSTNNPAHTNAVALDPLDNGTDRVDTPQAEDGDPGQAPDADPDGDGASNLEEFQWWYQNIYLAGGGVCEAGSPTNRISPDPTQADTDADGIPDMWEMVNGLDPTDPSDAGVDSDGDGLSDGEEYRWSSDPYNPDTDGDGIPDGTEVSLGLYPAQADSDQDGLDDGFEQSIGTDPADADTTDRGLSDGDAYELGWDPASCTSVWRVLLWENFETAPSANWSSHYVNPYVPFNLWHLSQAEPDPKTNQIRYLYDRSTNTAYRVADDAPGGTNVLADYDIGSAILCALDSPLIDASAAETLFLSWNEYYETEPGNDVVEVLVRGGTDVNWVVVSPPVSGKSGASGPSQPARWVHRVVDISSFAGMSNVQVRFLFNAQNAINNEYAGWYVDDVAVFEGVTMSGWVRDVYGQPLVGAVVRALGGGLITNVVDGDRLGGLGRIFGETSTAADGSYRLTGLPQGRYYLKAEAPSYRAEFYDGALFAGGYGFGHELHPGVPFRDQVTAGTVVLTNYGGAAECHFELERGLGRAALAALWPAAEPVMVDGVVQEVWNGLTNAPAMTPYRTTNALPGGYNHPDWLTNQVVPSAAHDLGPGEHLVRIGTNDFGSLVKVTVRDGELAVVSAGTNKAAGKLYVAADDGGGYPVWIDYLETTNLTPCYVTLPQGLHLVWLYSSGMSFRPPVQQVEIRPASLTDAVFTNLAGSQSCGALRIVAEDIWGGVLTGATVLINGVAVGPADVAAGCSNTTPTIVTNLLPGQHVVTLLKDGYRQPPATFVQVAPHVTNVLAITLYDSDRDCDQVPDSSEVLSYTNIFLYHRADDPDGDGLSNLMEADQYVYHRVRMNLFAADSDGDALSDEAELGLDGAPDYLAMSCLATNVEEGTDTVPALFRGRFLEGINFFGATGVVAVECDAFMPSHHTCQVPALPSADGVLLRFEGIPSAGDDQAITVSHVAGAVVEADTRPDEVDTDGDGMWDGFEVLYGLNALACGGENDDPDNDGLSNLEEFLGGDGVANTNDWTDPHAADTDGDGIPDGWEVGYGLDPRDPADAMQDPDGDGLVNLSEYLAGTNPKLEDTDGDYLPDAAEILTYHTDPNVQDTDGDGLIDGREVWDKDLDGVQDGGFFPQWNGGDLDQDGMVDGPTDWDTDGDGIPDGWEVMDEFGNLRDPALDPYDPTDGALDPDEDGLCNLEEYLVRNAQVGHPPSDFGYPGAVWDYATDPFNADSDGDGMPDGWEVWFGLHPMDPVPAEYGGSITRYDALSAQGDLDGDGLWNLREYQVRYYLDSQSSTSEIYGLSTSPWNPDSDGDGLEDGEEDREFRSNPVLEDSDGDGLADGTAETGTWAEVESSPRTNMSYQYVACSTCTWEQARSKAAVYHPGYIYCQGHLATVTSSDENQRVASVVPAGATAYLGGYNPGAVSDEWYWVTGEDFVYSNFPSGSPTIVSGVMNYLAISAAGSWESVTGQVDGYVIEWDCLPSATNHFDRALNDLWMLTWPSGDDWPHWTRVEPEADSLIPPPRWGAAAVYVPVFETKNPRDDDAGGGGATILLDNRKLLVFGGQDGVYRYNDIWEFLVRSNCWRRSSSQLEPLAPAGLSQHAAVLFLGYKDTKPDSCECSWVPYECDGEGFLEPKSRPWADSRSFDWTFLFGGWDMEHAYRGWQSSGFFFKSDDSEAVEETCYADSESTEYVEHKTEVHPGWTVSVTSVQVDWAGHDEVESCRIFGGPYTRIYEQLHGMITTYYTNQYLGTNGFFFAGMAGAGLCETILQAWLEFRLDSATTAAVDICVSAEFNPRSGVEMANYYKHKPGERFVSNGWYFNSSSVYYTIEAGLDQGSVFTVDVISAVSEAVGRYGFRDADGLGFIVIASNLNGSTAFIQQNSARLRVFYRPAYRVDAYWEKADDVGAEYVDRAPSQRKGTALVYDYEHQRLVLFGGIDGNEVLGDTHEGAVDWSGSFDPNSVTWTQIVVSGESPCPRWGHSMVYDAAHDRVMLFGGFDAQHRPLNDLWIYQDRQWSQVLAFASNERPRPRGGAALIYYGDFDYRRGIPGYCVGNNRQRVILFGGTDGESYFNDTWVLDQTSDGTLEWVRINPIGPNSQGPTPRAFASVVWAQNGRNAPDPLGESDYRDSDEPPCAVPCVYLFGGRSGTLPTGRDTDGDLLDDGLEYRLGGPAAGRDPRVNRLVEPDNTNDTIPFAYKRIGPVVLGEGHTVLADFESLRHDQGEYAAAYGLPFEFHTDQWSRVEVELDYLGQQVGVDAAGPDQTALWYHRYGGEDPCDPRDVWELGRPDDSSLGAGGAPPHAHSGDWCYGTDLNGTYPADALMELYSPLFDLRIPSADSTDTNNLSSYFLVFYEWLDLADSNDVVRVDIVRPETEADVMQRRSGTSRSNIVVVAPRNNAYNTTGAWRRVVAPLDVAGNETNLYLRFTLQSDGSGVAGGWYVDDVAIVQAAEISGVLTNSSASPWSNVVVLLLGENFDGEVLASTVSDGNGHFAFGLLPVGRYKVGAIGSVFGPFDVSGVSDLGATNVEELVIRQIGSAPGAPTQLRWPAVPGMRYRVEYCPALPGPWYVLNELTATDTNAVYVDWGAREHRFYRIVIAGD